MIEMPKQLEAMLAPTLRTGEYIGEDGLIHCTSCRGRRQAMVTVGDRTIYPRVLCACQRVAEDARKQTEKIVELRDKIQRNRAIGLSEPQHRAYTFELDQGYNPELMGKARRYAENWEQMYGKGMGLLIWGDVGTGKSFAAGCIANALLDRGISVMMTNFSRILNALSSLQWGDRNQYIDNLNQYSLLIIDDLGIERGTEYVLEQVYSIIDSRYRSGKPLIITTNLSLKEMKEPCNVTYARIYDRVLERCVPVHVTGQNIREQKSAENIRTAREMLCGET